MTLWGVTWLGLVLPCCAPSLPSLPLSLPPSRLLVIGLALPHNSTAGLADGFVNNLDGPAEAVVFVGQLPMRLAAGNSHCAIVDVSSKALSDGGVTALV